MRAPPFRAAYSILACVALITSLGECRAQAQNAIKIDGSMGSMPLLQALAKIYQTKSPTLIEFGKGMSPKLRIEALANGTIDIALASHGLNVDAINRQGMRIIEVARTAVVFAVNASVGLDNVTNDQVCGIFAGRIANWKEIGGPDLAVAAHARPENEVDTEVVRDGVVCLKTLSFAPSVKIVQRGTDMTRDLTDTKGAIGMTTTTVVEQSGGKIKALQLNGIVADEANVTSAKYRIVREVLMVVKSASSPAVQQFVGFIHTPEAASIIKANGALPTAERR